VAAVEKLFVFMDPVYHGPFFGSPHPVSGGKGATIVRRFRGARRRRRRRS